MIKYVMNRKEGKGEEWRQGGQITGTGREYNKIVKGRKVRGEGLRYEKLYKQSMLQIYFPVYTAILSYVQQFADTRTQTADMFSFSFPFQYL
jgi:hypothetical protein